MRHSNKVILIICFCFYSFCLCAQDEEQSTEKLSWSSGFSNTRVGASLDWGWPIVDGELKLQGGYSLNFLKIISSNSEFQLTVSQRRISHDFNQYEIDNLSRVSTVGKLQNVESRINAAIRIYRKMHNSYAPFGNYFKLGAGYSLMEAEYPSIYAERSAGPTDPFERPLTNYEGRAIFFIIGFGKEYPLTEHLSLGLGIDFNLGSMNITGPADLYSDVSQLMNRKNLFHANYGLTYIF